LRIQRRCVFFYLFLMLLADGVWIARASAASVDSQTAVAAIQPPETQSTVAAEIQAQARGRLKKFYTARSFAPLWASSGKIGPEADALLGFLATANLDGLKPSSYKIDDLRRVVTEAGAGDAKLVARAELKLSDAFAHYAGDMRRPSKFMKAYLKGELKPKKPKAEAVLGAAAFSSSFIKYMSSMGWMSPHYLRLRTILSHATERGSSDDVLRRIRLNMERAQALPGPWTHHVVVDAASGRLWYYQAGKQLGTMRVIVGKPEAPTPMLAGMLQYAILNPYWNVPTDLAQHHIAPKVLAGRSLKVMGMEALSDWSASPQKLDPATINWSAVASGAQELRLRQLPGASNSMGRVKFMFPNDFGIYLHDTPERELFAKENRHFSNGCIRLEEVETLGKWLLGKSIKASSKVPEQIVAMPISVPVYLTYFSVMETKQGEVVFLQDVYGRDQ
jgi:L,D-transpeptidase YcbB